MKSITSPMAKLERHRCDKCGIEAPAPIVVRNEFVGYQCTNAKACAVRQRPRRAKARSFTKEKPEKKS